MSVLAKAQQRGCKLGAGSRGLLCCDDIKTKLTQNSSWCVEGSYGNPCRATLVKSTLSKMCKKFFMILVPAQI